MRRAALASVLLGLAAPAPLAAQHQHHGAETPAPAPTPDPTPDPEPAPDLHAAHAGEEPGGAPGEPPSPGPEFETPPPPEAGSGPPRAADAIWGAEAMAAARAALRRSHGDFPLFWFQGDRIETQLREGADGFLWDIQGYYGGPTRRLWFKSEGEGARGDGVEEAALQALYAAAFAPFWAVQAGLRQDLAGPDTTHAVIGVQGLAPYMFEIDAALFLSTRGDLTARIEAEIDQRITQRLILQPRVEANLSAQDIPRLGIGAGLDELALGARLRYEFAREFAPYVGIEQSWRGGRGADFARARGEDPSVTTLVAGIRFWF